MPRAQSFPLTPSGNLCNDFNVISSPKGPYGPSVPLFSQSALPSPPPANPSAQTPTMATAFHENMLPKAPSQSDTLMALNEQNAAQWAMSGDLPVDGLADYNTSCQLPMQYLQSPTALYTQNGVPYAEKYNLALLDHASLSCPRSYAAKPGLSLTGLSLDTEEYYPPNAYQIEPQMPYESVDVSDQSITGQLIQMKNDYDDFVSIQQLAEQPGYSSPTPSVLTRGSTTSGDAPCFPQENDRELPYAQLIYRALMEAPGHTMILRDIYDWFLKNTDKAADKETKGWQNSIRHNLSMNGAFEKVDQPGDEPKKGFLWRLTQQAIREGVKSTTRYRSKHPNKRGFRHAPATGGHAAARRTARLRRTTAAARPGSYRSEPYTSVLPPMGPAFMPDISMSYPAPSSPYLFADPADADLARLNFVSAAPLNAFNAGAGVQSILDPLPHEAAFDLALDAAEPLFAATSTDTPSPPADEPRTPEPASLDAGYSDLAFSHAQYAYESAYDEYPL